MGKGHRDNHAARMKRGPEAFAKKAKRRKFTQKCNMCRSTSRNLVGGLCPKCLTGQGPNKA